VVNIVDANNWKKPIYFAVTVSDDNLMGLGPYLKMQGLVYRLTPNVIAEKDRLDIARTVHLLDHIYRFRGLGDGTARLNDTSEKLLSNYAASYIQIALSMRRPLTLLKTEVEQLKATIADTSADSAAVASAKAIIAEKESSYKDSLSLVLDKLQQCIGFMPDDWRPRVLRHEVLMGHNMSEEAEKGMKEALAIEPDNKEYMKYYVQALEKNGKKSEANEVLKKMLQSESDPWYAHVTLAKNYEDQGMFDSAIAVMEQFTLTHPGDRRAASLIQQLKSKKVAAQKPPAEPTDDSAASSDTAVKAPQS